MYYSTYRLTLVAIYVLVAGLVSFAISFNSPDLAILVAVTYGILGLILLPIHFLVMGARLRQFNGVFPHPSWVWPRFQWPRIIDDRRPTAEAGTSDEGASSRPICPNCRTVAAIGSAKYCHECGTPFPRASGSSPSR